MSLKHVKGRGAQHNSFNKFLEHRHEVLDEYRELCRLEGEEAEDNRTSFIDTYPKTIVNKVHSPDVGMDYSMNPYQGCEHGCVYCFARNSHEYWGYSAGRDFEQKVLVKRNAPQLLEELLKKKSWQVAPIVMSGNTDCYQPAERQLEITRACLKVFAKYKHPVGIITKNALILRDLEILKELAEQNLVRVMLSITSLQEETRRLLEPRTSSIKQRLKTLEILSKANIPTGVMMAPIIPALNCHEILPLAREVADRGALKLNHTVVRLNGAIAEIFEEWLRRTMPARADRIMNQIAACHDGKVNDSRFGQRMRGSGPVAEQIKAQFTLSRKRYFSDRQLPELDCSLHLQMKTGQIRLFE